MLVVVTWVAHYHQELDLDVHLQLSFLAKRSAQGRGLLLQTVDADCLDRVENCIRLVVHLLARSNNMFTLLPAATPALGSLDETLVIYQGF